MSEALLALQEQVCAYLLGTDAPPADLLASIRPSATLRSAERLAIYHHAYRMRMAETLQDSFEHTATYLGEDEFAEIAATYIEQTPSTDANLRGYGAGLPVFLATRYPLSPEVAELAEMDWQLRAAFDVADAPVLDPDALRQVAAEAWATIRLVFHPSVRVVTQRCATIDLWQALNSQQVLPPPTALPAPRPVLIWRRDEQPHFMSIEDEVAWVVTESMSGRSFASLCADRAQRTAETSEADNAAQAGARAAAAMGSILRRLLDLRVLSGLPAV